MATKTATKPGGGQPEPFTPGVRRGEVRDYAFKLFQLKLEKGEPLTRADWVEAEKELVKDRQEAEA
ncbi:MAG: hypothetical protein HZA91_00615 [Verrucomicrobia bacterium]|nr:hypothetical protein [Verrucomicrobiota bacterium]